MHKRFPGVHALKGVDFAVERGTVHALVGENGAGKSTLMKILAGSYPPDEGEVYFLGEQVTFRSARDALDVGISTIYQDLLLCPNLSVAENIFLGREPTRGPFVGNADLLARCREELHRIGFEDLEPEARVSRLSVAQRQMVEIARALVLDSELIIMDEPTASLTPDEVERLFRTVTRLKEQNKALIFISHRIEEVFEIANHVTVLRDGALVGSRPISELTPEEVVRMMVARDLVQALAMRNEGDGGEVLLEVEGLSREGVLGPVSFTLRRYEVLGFAGLVGAGRTELMRAIFGVDPVDSGRVLLEGKEARINSPSDAKRLGIGMTTEDRKEDGIFGQMSVGKNMTMAALGLGAFTRKLGFLRGRQEESVANEYRSSMDIRTPSVATPIISLSGGNQQKVILSRWLMTEPKVLIMDEPTSGIDVGAKSEIYRLIRELAAEGRGIIVVSSELLELLAVCDRIVVMKEGRLVAHLKTADTTQEEIMTYATIGSDGKGGSADE